jgi:hypothetical protein
MSRDALLPQPGGFEGFVSRSEPQNRSDDLSLAKLVQVELVHVYRDAACLALSLPSTASDANTSPTPSKSPRLKAALARLAASTFSCDIAYSDSPAASRASSLVR